MSPGMVVLLLALLLGLQAVTTDLYLPALPMLTASFKATTAQAQLTLTALLLAFGVSQLFWGPLSDRFGRRPILLVGMSMFLVSSVACTLAANMAMLIAFRAVQGAAMGAAVMCARAIVRDLYTPVEGAKAMSRGLSGLGLIACVSLPIGAVLSTQWGWRASLAAVAIFGAATLCLVALRFQETLQKPNPKALQFGVLASTWRGILQNATFRAFCALSVCSYGGLFTYLASSSFVYIEVLGLSPNAFSLVLVASALAYIPGTFLCRRLLLRFGVRKTVAIGGVITLAAGSAMGLLALAGIHTVWALMLPFCGYMVGHGIHQACGQSGAVAPFPQAAGAAAALNGFLMMVVAFAIGGWLGQSLNGTVYPMALGVWFWAALIALNAWTLVQKHGASIHV
jgi:MFS transporter, DHA1 family, multidrug resistance protein